MGQQTMPPRIALQLLVATIAGYAIAAMLAPAEIDGFCFLCLEFFGNKFGTFVASIAKRLPGTLAAGAIPITFTGFNFNGIGGLLSDEGFIF